MRRVKLRLADLDVEFADRDTALRQVEEFAERGTYPVYVIYGPEGCGKTALFRQAKAILEEHGYIVIYFSPMEKEFEYRLSVSDDAKELVKPVLEVLLGENGAKFVERAIELASRVMRYRERVAVLADDIFQAVGLERAEIYVKMLLNLIEYPSAPIERVVVLVGSSEGTTRVRVGRHSWALLRGMWNMSRDGFRELYEQISGEKPSFDEVWRWTGGNPRYLAELYKAEWDVEVVVKGLVRRKGLDKLAKKWRQGLERAVEDPDYLWDEYPRTEGLIQELTELNLLSETGYRDTYLWIDQPPPVDKELGIGEKYAWQTPLHREAVRRILREIGS
ncbi:ATP-binding protein [Infirmifilum lucidum]|uniref:ATP-binding protein n=1 Tax=Infirmifilum lucidum TaxID=2776706 RepID=A0A7L9FHH2_9CREN|nr:ATP-binding protein [Infirmifilum lucidum]QOJ79278.1 ATP-binding protein [Infirmifilum lucidum]